MAKIPVLKLLITISIYCCVFANGICSNIYGPTWLDLKNLMNTTLERMSLSISLRAAFFCCGAIIGAFVYRLIDRGALYPFFVLTKGLCVGLIPLYADFHSFLAFSALIGLVSGAADTSINVWIIDIWQDKSAPFIQAGQFFWAVGFIVSPLISNPFLSPDNKAKKLGKNITTIASTTMASVNERLVAYNKDQNFTSTESFATGTTSVPILNEDLVSLEEHLIVIQESKIYIPYAVAGSICLIGSVSLLAIYIYHKIQNINNSNIAKNQDQYSKTEQIENKKDVNEKKVQFDELNSHEDIQFTKSKCYLIQILLLCCIMISAFCASEMTSFQYIPTFTVCLGFSKSTGSMLMTAVAVSFAIGRFCGILCAIKFKPIHIMWADLAFILAGNLILLLSKSDFKFLWLGSLLIGFGYASFFAAIFSFLRERIVVDNFMSSIVILSSLSGNAIGFPVFIGKYMDKMPLMMIYGNLFCLFIMFICCLGLLILDCRFGIKDDIIKQLKKNQENEMVEKLKVEIVG